MRIAFASFVFVLACGPATASVLPVAGPDGQSGWLQVNCPGSPSKCRELASESCPGGYEVEDFRIGSASRYDSPSAMEAPIGPPDKSGQMLVLCKGSIARPSPSSVP